MVLGNERGLCCTGDPTDMMQEPRRKAFERLIRTVLSFPHSPAVIVFMVFPHRNAYWKTSENDMVTIAQHYQVPVLSVR